MMFKVNFNLTILICIIVLNLTATSYQHDFQDQTGSDSNHDDKDNKLTKTNSNGLTSLIPHFDGLQHDKEQSMPQFMQDIYRNPNLAYDYKAFHRATDKHSMSRIICIPHIGKEK